MAKGDPRKRNAAGDATTSRRGKRNRSDKHEPGQWRAAGDRAVTEAMLEDAALELLAEKGVLAGLNLREVADRVQVNRGLVYHYFGSRRELLRSALRRRGRPLARQLHEQRTGQPFAKRIVSDLRTVQQTQGYQLITLLVLDGDPEARVIALKGESLALLERDREAGHIPSDADIEGLHVLAASLIAGYSLFRERFAAELNVPVEELDERVPKTLERVLAAYRPARRRTRAKKSADSA